ncbi:Nucleoid occlusion factor SlmA [bioreactor metagenome]|uniref:Nucleoid occlusion factor SlmA n=1 Tax=bioreactor metagenome TaxID=1076179 RepID=A0A645DTP9_9ZZZZ|nr:TetR/AcrR family transcriptional regulator [Erysipelotrichaceae bacterium]
MSNGNNKRSSAKEKLIRSGIKVIEHNGIQGFSLRKAAEECGISCAAPYKHFKNKDEFLTKIIQYINEEWLIRQEKIVRKYTGDIREQLINICLAYIDFLVENPQYRSIIMIKDESLSPENNQIRYKISDKSRELINIYCQSERILLKTEAEKIFIIRSLIYGASLMFDNGELAYNEENRLMIYQAIDHQFELTSVDKSSN